LKTPGRIKAVGIFEIINGLLLMGLGLSIGRMTAVAIIAAGLLFIVIGYNMLKFKIWAWWTSLVIYAGVLIFVVGVNLFFVVDALIDGQSGEYIIGQSFNMGTNLQIAFTALIAYLVWSSKKYISEKPQEEIQSPKAEISNESARSTS
jgi:membrane-bound ClpP family serine protease